MKQFEVTNRTIHFFLVSPKAAEALSPRLHLIQLKRVISNSKSNWEVEEVVNVVKMSLLKMRRRKKKILPVVAPAKTKTLMIPMLSSKKCSKSKMIMTCKLSKKQNQKEQVHKIIDHKKFIHFIPNFKKMKPWVFLTI